MRFIVFVEFKNTIDRSVKFAEELFLAKDTFTVPHGRVPTNPFTMLCRLNECALAMFVSEDAGCRDTVNTTGESMSAVQARQEEARRKRRRKKRSGSSLMSCCFQGKKFSIHGIIYDSGNYGNKTERAPCRCKSIDNFIVILGHTLNYRVYVAGKSEKRYTVRR